MLYSVSERMILMNRTLKRDDADDFFCTQNAAIPTGYGGCAQHYHTLFELYYMASGKCSYFVDDKLYEIEQGDLLLIPGGVIHKSIYPDNNYARYLINCSKYYIPASVFPVLSKLTYVYHNKDIQSEIEKTFLEVEKNYLNPDPFSSDSIRSLMHNLFILLARTPNQKSNNVSKILYSERAIEYIRSNFKSEITLDHIARMCSVSPEHMSRTFKKQTGFGFLEYLTHIRLQHAEFMLKNTSLPITEIASECGFCDSNYFSVIFKKNYGFSPRELKKKI